MIQEIHKTFSQLSVETLQFDRALLQDGVESSQEWGSFCDGRNHLLYSKCEQTEGLGDQVPALEKDKATYQVHLMMKGKCN